MMKKILVVVVLAFAAEAVFAQSDLPTEAEAAMVIEGYFHCIGNSDIEKVKSYAMGNFLESAQVYIKIFNIELKNKLKNYKIEIVKIEKLTSTTFLCSYKDDNIFYTGVRGPLTATLTRENTVLKITN